MVLFSGDGDFRSLVEAVQRRGVRVTVVSTVSTQPPMVADELRRQADIFLDIVELQPKIGRDPSERPPREPRDRASRASASTRRSSCSAAPRRSARGAGADDDDEDSIGRSDRRTICAAWPAGPPNRAAIARSARGLSRSAKLGAQREPAWFNAPVPSFGPLDARLLIVGLAPGLQGANRTGRPFTGDYAGDLLYDTLMRFGFARGDYEARPDDGPTLVDCPHHQCGALRAAGKQADAGRDQHLPRFPHRHHRRNAEAARHRGARPHRA